MYEKAIEASGHGAITTEVLDAPPLYYAEDYHQQYLAKNPFGYCGLGGTGGGAARSASAPPRRREAGATGGRRRAAGQHLAPPIQ